MGGGLSVCLVVCRCVLWLLKDVLSIKMRFTSLITEWMDGDFRSVIGSLKSCVGLFLFSLMFFPRLSEKLDVMSSSILTLVYHLMF